MKKCPTGNILTQETDPDNLPMHVWSTYQCIFLSKDHQHNKTEVIMEWANNANGKINAYRTRILVKKTVARGKMTILCYKCVVTCKVPQLLQ